MINCLSILYPYTLIPLIPLYPYMPYTLLPLHPYTPYTLIPAIPLYPLYLWSIYDQLFVYLVPLYPYTLIPLYPYMPYTPLPLYPLYSYTCYTLVPLIPMINLWSTVCLSCTLIPLIPLIPLYPCTPYLHVYLWSIYDQLYAYLMKNNLLSKHQSCFRAVHWMVTALLEATDSWVIDRKLFSAIVFLDLKKAFDTVVHEILLFKLCLYRICFKLSN